MLLDIGRRIEEPTRFDFRAARARACILAMARAQDQGDLSGVTHRALAEGAKAVQTLSPKAGRAAWYNLVIETDHGRLRALRDALRRRAGETNGQGEMELLSEVSIGRTDAGTVEELLQLRRSRLLKAEKEFVKGLSLDWRESSNR